eukprot:9926441-Lingulodinium_polyedra.AAC.1
MATARRSPRSGAACSASSPSATADAHVGGAADGPRSHVALPSRADAALRGGTAKAAHPRAARIGAR